MTFYDVTPGKPPLLKQVDFHTRKENLWPTREEAAALNGHICYDEADKTPPFDWVGKVEPHPFRGLPYIIAAIVLPWLFLGAWFLF